jgi:EKC/KEOPS complex subunit PCC1/LAGE3
VGFGFDHHRTYLRHEKNKWLRLRETMGAMSFLANCTALMLDNKKCSRGGGTDIKICRDINIPFPTAHLASVALKALSVDKELSPLVHRSFSLVSAASSPANEITGNSHDTSVLNVVYRATTNRMLRVSVNGFFESLRLVVEVMEDLDADVAMDESSGELTGVQGLGEVAVGV